MTLYEILGVPTSAAQKDIESVYNSLKKNFLNPRDVRWQEIQYAYSVLSDRERREAYDLLIGLYVKAPGEREACKCCALVKDLQKKDRTISQLITVMILLLVALCLTITLCAGNISSNAPGSPAAGQSPQVPLDPPTPDPTAEPTEIPTASPTPDPAATPAPIPTQTLKPTPRPTPTPDPMQKFKVTATARMDSNNSVGHDWSYDYEVNGSPVGSGFTLYLKDGERVDLYAKCVESDSIPDIGTNSIYILADKDFFNTGFYVEVPVTVKENRGRYSGNTAKFTITFDFAPI